MTTEKQQNSHRPPTDGGMAEEEFIRLGRETPYRGRRGTVEPQGGQRAVEEPKHGIILQGGSQRQRP